MAARVGDCRADKCRSFRHHAPTTPSTRGAARPGAPSPTTHTPHTTRPWSLCYQIPRNTPFPKCNTSQQVPRSGGVTTYGASPVFVRSLITRTSQTFGTLSPPSKVEGPGGYGGGMPPHNRSSELLCSQNLLLHRDHGVGSCLSHKRP